MTKTSYFLVIGLVCLSFLASCTFPRDESQERDDRRNSDTFMEKDSSEGHSTRGPRNSPDSPIQTAPISDSGNTASSPSQNENPNISSGSSVQNSVAPVTTKKIVSYITPSHRGNTTTEFSVTTQDGIITAASATFQSGDHDDQKYQNAFSRSISSAVVGKKTNNMNLDVIGGASLTTAAFEQFIKSL